MIYISHYKRLKVMLRPTRREVHEMGGDQEVIIHPPLICEFEDGRFDTEKMFPILKERINCCERHALKSEDQLIKALEGNIEFNQSFSRFHQESKEEQIAKLKEQLAELEGTPVMAPSVPENIDAPEGDDDKDPKDPQIQQPGPNVDYEAMEFSELKVAFEKKFGFKCPVISKENVIKALRK